MSNVYVTDLGVPRTARNKRRYGDVSGDSFRSVTTGGLNSPPIQITPIDIIELTAQLPIISDYNTLYAPTHGQYPRLELIIDNGDGTRYRSMQMPQFTTISSGGGIEDLIDTVFWDTGETVTGFIILN